MADGEKHHFSVYRHVRLIIGGAIFMDKISIDLDYLNNLERVQVKCSWVIKL